MAAQARLRCEKDEKNWSARFPSGLTQAGPIRIDLLPNAPQLTGRSSGAAVLPVRSDRSPALAQYATDTASLARRPRRAQDGSPLPVWAQEAFCKAAIPGHLASSS